MIGINKLPRLPFLGAAVIEIGFKSQFRRILGEAVARVHLDAVVFTTALVRLLVGATISRAREGEEFVESVSETAQAAAGAIDNTITPSCPAGLGFGLAAHLFGDFDKPVKDVAQRAAELAGSRVGGAGRRLDIRRGEAAKSEKSSGKNDEFFHAGKRLGFGWRLGNAKVQGLRGNLPTRAKNHPHPSIGENAGNRTAH